MDLYVGVSLCHAKGCSLHGVCTNISEHLGLPPFLWCVLLALTVVSMLHPRSQWFLFLPDWIWCAFGRLRHGLQLVRLVVKKRMGATQPTHCGCRLVGMQILAALALLGPILRWLWL